MCNKKMIYALAWTVLGVTVHPPRSWCLAPTIKIEGDQDFKDKVDAALMEIRSADSRCAKMLDELIASTNVHKIVVETGPVSSLTPSNSANAKNGTGSGSTTRWNPDAVYRYRDDVLRNAVAALKHELTHAHDVDNGVLDCGVDPQTGIVRAEIVAVRAENRFRCGAGLKWRMAYGGATLPGVRETVCMRSECHLRFRSFFDDVDCVIVHQMANLQDFFNSCFAIEEIPFAASDLEDLDDSDDDHIAENKRTGVASATIVLDAKLCCGDDIDDPADCTTCNEFQCSADYWRKDADKFTAYCTAKTNSCGTVPAMIATGVPSATASSGFEIAAQNTKAQKFGTLLYTDAGRAAFPFQGGILCLNPPLRRALNVSDVSGTPGSCDGELAIDMNAFASGTIGGNPAAFLAMPGTQVNTQWWGRDTVANGSLLSDGLEYFVGP